MPAQAVENNHIHATCSQQHSVLRELAPAPLIPTLVAGTADALHRKSLFKFFKLATPLS